MSGAAPVNGTRPLSILFVTNALGVGGIETNLVRLTQALVGRGHRVTVASRGGPLGAAASAAGGHLLPLAVQPANPRRLYDDVRILRRFLADQRPDVVHVFSASGAIVL